MTHPRIPLAAVIGSPVAHSKSPKLHNYWLSQHELPGHYIPLDVGRDDFAETLAMLPKMGFVGANVTIPFKELALELSDKATDRATLMGAANTLIFRKDGLLHADNTDGYGFISNLQQSAPKWEPNGGPATILGAGGAARAVIASLIEVGAENIMLTNRTRQRAEALREDFGSKVQVVDWIQAGNILEESATVINTTSLGMVGHPELRIPLDGLQPGTLVTDLVYAPLQTRLLRTAAEMGCVTVDGLGMLLHQAVPAFERWFGVRPTVDDNTRMAVLG